MALNLVMLGPPAAGKGTQARRLAAEFRIPHISTGDMLREAVQAGTAVGAAAKAVMDAGRLVGDELILEIVRGRLSRPDTREGFVLDGFPRTVAQASDLDALMTGRAPLLVVEVVVPAEALVARAVDRRVCRDCSTITTAAHAACPTCGGTLVQRRDDTADIVRERLRVYERDTRPLVAYYRNRPTFQPVDGNQPPDAVASEIRHAVDTIREAAGLVGRPR
jgi:adenylate kinase